MQFRWLWALFLLTAVVPLSFSTPMDARYGVPFATTYLPDAYHAEGQNFDVAVTSKNLIYVANSGGVLEYDGQTWRTIAGTRETIVLSLEADSRDRVWVGRQDDFGVLLPDSIQGLRYHSLRAQIPGADSLIGDVWRIRNTPDGLFFLSPKWILRWRPDPDNALLGEAHVWPAGNSNFTLCCRVNGHMLVRRIFHPLEEIVGDSLQVFPYTASKVRNNFVHAVPYDSTTILLTSYIGELYLADPEGVRPMPGEINAEVKTFNKLGIVPLTEGRFALSTSTDGIYIFDRQGQISDHLVDYQQLSLKIINREGVRDHNGGIWFPLDYGLIRMDLNAPLRVLGRQAGMTGAILRIIKFRGGVYYSGAEGLFRLTNPGGPGLPPVRERVGDVDFPVWRMETLGNSLLLSSLRGLWMLKPDGPVEQVGQYRDNMGSIAVTRDHSAIFVATEMHGIVLYENRGGSIRQLDTLALNQAKVNDLSMDRENFLWMVSRSGADNVLSRARVDERHPEELTFRPFGAEDGLQGEISTAPFYWQDTLRMITSEGLHNFDAAHERFTRADLPGGEDYFRNTEEDLPVEDSQGRLYLSPAPYRFYEIDPNGAEGMTVSQPLHPALARRIFSVCTDLESGLVAAGGDDGRLFFFDPAVKPSRPSPDILIRSVLYRGRDHHLVNLRFYDAPVTLPGTVPSLRFSYSMTAYDMPDRNQYQYRMLEDEDEWSSWSEEPYHDFSNLKEGVYRFEVRGKDGYGNVTAPASFTFEILAPWYRTWWMLLVWALLFAAIVVGIVRYRVRRLLHQQMHLEQLVRQRTEELQEAQRKEIQEIEARKAAEIEAQRLKTATQLAATIAHEFNNPLGVIQGYCDLASMDVGDQDTVVTRMNRIRGQVKRMHDLVKKLLRLNTLQEIDYAAGLKILNIHAADMEKESANTELKRKDLD